MGKGKLERWSIFENQLRCFQHTKELAGHWKETVFKNNHPLVLELAAGRAEYTVGLSALYPEKNFLAIDVKSHRLLQGARICESEGRFNTAFVRAQIDHILELFAPGEVDEIWITFPDPQLSKPDWRKRLTSPRFLERYERIAKPGAVIHLKTDNTELYEWTLEQVQERKYPVEISISDLYNHPEYKDELRIKTYYENMFVEKGETVKYMRFRLS